MSLHGIGRDGELRLTYARRERSDMEGTSTFLAENYSRPPLQVMQAIRDRAGCLCVYLLSPTGGIVQGDRYAIHIRACEGTHGLLTTPAATKVYKMPDGCAEQSVRIEVKRGAVFEFVPEAAILFADADLRQRIEVTLHDGALLLLHEIVMPGRLARGERLQFRRYENRIIVRDAAGLLLHDTAVIEPARNDLDAVGVLEGYSCWGSAYLLGDLAGRGIEAQAFCAAHQGIFARGDALGALSPLYRNGISARMVSHHLDAIYAAFHTLRETVRSQYLGLPDAPLRK